MDISAIFQIILVIIKVIFGLSVLVLFHEFGHFMMAKLAGIWVEEFGLGLPPRVWGKKVGDTLYTLNLLPIGGFVKLHGETGDTAKYPEKAFFNASKIKKIEIALAGIFMNFVLAVLAFALFYTLSGIPTQIQTGQVKVLDVSVDSPAQAAGLHKDDIIIKIEDQAVTSSEDFVSEVSKFKGKTVQLDIYRPTAKDTFERLNLVANLKDVDPDKGTLGVVISSTDIDYYFPPLLMRPFVGISYGITDSIKMTKLIVGAFSGIAGEVSKGQAPEGVYGPVGIFAILAYVAELGILPLINFIGIFSINLAIFNLIPFPPLDGSRVLLVGIEAAFSRKILPKIENAIYTMGMIVILLLFIVMTAREVPQLIKAGSINNFVESIIPN